MKGSCAIGIDVVRKRVATCTIVVLLLLLASLRPVYSQNPITVTEAGHEHVFKESITFSLAAESSGDITSIKLFFRVSGQTSSHKAEPEFEAGKSVEVSYTEDMEEPENYQPPMITLTYWWVIEDAGGNRLKTDLVSFVYDDTRYDWERLESERVHLYWHDQEEDFGQHFFDIADDAATQLSSEFDVVPSDPVSIVIYNSHEELMSVLQESSAEWTGAVTFGGRAGVIAVGLGPMSWMERVIPHELTHAMLYLVTKPPFGEIPRWLHEGLAVRSEGGMSAEERLALAEAIQEDKLIALRALNSPFPDERERAILSYAESSSLIEYIIEVHGVEKLAELIAVFAEGAHYDDAMLEVFGVDMDGMEDIWRAHIGAQPRAGATRATPVASATAVPTQGVEAAQTDTPRPTQTPTLTPAATSTGDEVATATPTRLDPEAETPVTPGSRAAPCLGAVPALALVALFVAFRPRRQ